MPIWANVLEFAKEFGISPHEVAGSVPLRWWYRWLTWNKIKSSREAWDTFNSSGRQSAEPKEMREIRLWALMKDER